MHSVYKVDDMLTQSRGSQCLILAALFVLVTLTIGLFSPARREPGIAAKRISEPDINDVRAYCDYLAARCAIVADSQRATESTCVNPLAGEGGVCLPDVKLVTRKSQETVNRLTLPAVGSTYMVDYLDESKLKKVYQVPIKTGAPLPFFLWMAAEGATADASACLFHPALTYDQSDALFNQCFVVFYDEAVLTSGAPHDDQMNCVAFRTCARDEDIAVSTPVSIATSSAIPSAQHGTPSALPAATPSLAQLPASSSLAEINGESTELPSFTAAEVPPIAPDFATASPTITLFEERPTQTLQPSPLASPFGPTATHSPSLMPQQTLSFSASPSAGSTELPSATSNGGSSTAVPQTTDFDTDQSSTPPGPSSEPASPSVAEPLPSTPTHTPLATISPTPVTSTTSNETAPPIEDGDDSHSTETFRPAQPTDAAEVAGRATPDPQPSSTLAPTVVIQVEAACFPGHATVQVRTSGKFEIKLMKDLELGDVVRSGIGADEVSTVFAFGHRVATEWTNYVALNLFDAGGQSRTLEVSADHLLIKRDGSMLAAGDVAVDDVLAGDFAVSTINSVQREGIFHPHTISGTMMVDGILVSCYTTSVRSRIAHALLSAPRLLLRHFKTPLPFVRFFDRHHPTLALCSRRLLSPFN